MILKSLILLNAFPPALKAISTIMEFATFVTPLVKTVLVPPPINVLLAMKPDHFTLLIAPVLKNAQILSTPTRINLFATPAISLALDAILILPMIALNVLR